MGGTCVLFYPAPTTWVIWPAVKINRRRDGTLPSLVSSYYKFRKIKNGHTHVLWERNRFYTDGRLEGVKLELVSPFSAVLAPGTLFL